MYIYRYPLYPVSNVGKFTHMTAPWGPAAYLGTKNEILCAWRLYSYKFLRNLELKHYFQSLKIFLTHDTLANFSFIIQLVFERTSL